ncbi:RT23 protein, partial [Spizella passerina]|nr:RT23 protein [Spizella passerina]
MAATAGSRTQKIGSVFSRTRNLVRIGLLRKPLWLDVYAAFPPLREPVYRVPRPRYGSGDPIGAVLYREDTVRACVREPGGTGECRGNRGEPRGGFEVNRGFPPCLMGSLLSFLQGAAPRGAASQPQLQALLGELQDKRKDGQEQPPELAGTQKESPCPS